MQELFRYELEWNLFVAVFFISKRHCKAHQSLSFGFFSFRIFSITFFIYQNVFTVKRWYNFQSLPCSRRIFQNCTDGLLKISDLKPSEFLETGPIFEKKTEFWRIPRFSAYSRITSRIFRSELFLICKWVNILSFNESMLLPNNSTIM